MVANYDIRRELLPEGLQVSVLLSSEKPLKPIPFYEDRQGYLIDCAIASELDEKTGSYIAVPTLIAVGDHPQGFELSVAGMNSALITGKLNVENRFFIRMGNDVAVALPELSDMDKQADTTKELALRGIRYRRYVGEVKKLYATFFKSDPDAFQELRSIDRLKWIARTSESLIKDQSVPELTITEMLRSAIGTNRHLLIEGETIDISAKDPNAEMILKKAKGNLKDIFIHNLDGQNEPTACIEIEMNDGYGRKSVECFVIKELETLSF